MRLERGEPIYDAMPGLGHEVAPGFPTDRCPVQLPDLQGFHSVAALVLRENPDIYRRLRKKSTGLGFSFAACIKPGMDDRGHPSAQPAGLIAGDAQCFEVFRELFDPVIRRLHDDFLPTVPQPLDAAPSKLSNTKLDALGLYVLSSCIVVRRNLAGFRMAPCCDNDERREVERLLARALLAQEGPAGGAYHPLASSQSYAPIPGGISRAEQTRLCAEGLIFDAPSSSAKLSAGLGRDWPDARGAFLVDGGRDLLAWLNEEDHLRVRVHREGADLRGTFKRAYDAVAKLQRALQEESVVFARDARLGYVTVDPVHLGAGLCCTQTVRLPCLGGRTELQAIGRALNLKVAWNQGAWDISNCSTLGVSEVDAANEVIHGCAEFVRLEELAASGGDVDSQLKAILAAS